MPEEIEVPTEGLQEKLEEAVEEAEHERAENKKERAWVARVAVSSALLAVAAAISALLAGHHANEAMFEKMEETSLWALYQAKGIKSNQLETKLVLLTALGKEVPLEKNGGPAGEESGAAEEGKKEKGKEKSEKKEENEFECPPFSGPATVEVKVKKYECEKKKIKKVADEKKEEAEAHMHHHVWFARAVTAFQIAIALGAIAVLAKRPRLWLLSVGLGALGSLLLVLGLL